MGVGEMHGYTIWIGEVGLWHWWKSGLVVTVMMRR